MANKTSAPSLQELMLSKEYQLKQAKYGNAQKSVIHAYTLAAELAQTWNETVSFARRLIPEIQQDLDATLKVLEDETQSPAVSKAS